MTPTHCAETGKLRYPSESSANAANAASAERRKAAPKGGKHSYLHLVPYRCEHCDAWHVGHKPGTGKRRLRAARRARRTSRKGFRF